MLGPDHQETLTTLASLALAHRGLGQLDQALPLFQQAAVVIESKRFEHPHAGPIISDLIACSEQVNKYPEAEAWRRKWLAVVKERAGTDSLPHAGELSLLGMNLIHQTKWAEAEPVLRECLRIREKLQPDVWSTFNAKSLLGGALAGQRKYDQAEPLLLAGYEGMKQRAAAIPPAGRTRLPEAADRLVQLYIATGRPAEATKWQVVSDHYWRIAPPPREKK